MLSQKCHSNTLTTQEQHNHNEFLRRCYHPHHEFASAVSISPDHLSQTKKLQLEENRNEVESNLPLLRSCVTHACCVSEICICCQMRNAKRMHPGLARAVLSCSVSLVAQLGLVQSPTKAALWDRKVLVLTLWSKLVVDIVKQWLDDLKQENDQLHQHGHVTISRVVDHMHAA